MTNQGVDFSELAESENAGRVSQRFTRTDENFITDIFGAENESSDTVVELDPENTDVDRDELFIVVAEATTKIIETANALGGPPKLSLDTDLRNSAGNAICPGSPYRIERKVMQAAPSAGDVVNSDLVILTVFVLLTLLSVARQPAAYTKRSNFFEELLITFKSTPLALKELQWLWRKHERQEPV